MKSRKPLKLKLLKLCFYVSYASSCIGQLELPTDTLEWRLGTRLGIELKGDLPATTTEWTVANDVLIASFKGNLGQLSLTSPSNEKAKSMSEQLLEANFLGCSTCVGEVELLIDTKHVEAKSGTIAFDGRKEGLSFTVLQEENQMLLTAGIDRRDFGIDFNHLGGLGLLMNFLLDDTIFLASCLSLPETPKIK